MAFSGLRGASSGLIAALRKGPRLRRRKAGRPVTARPATTGTGAPGATIASLAPLTALISTYLGDKEITLVRDAWRFADQAHLGQFRASGEPYITHPVA